MKNRILLLLFLAAVGTAKAQQIQNVQATQEGKTIVVSYDLTDNASGSTYEVELYCSTDGGSTFGKSLSAVSGDAGKEIKPGASRRISWDVLADREKLTGNRIVFEVRARTTDQAGIEMVFVKGGTFTMGCTSEQSDCDDYEKPAHQVTVSDFRMGKYEVTQKQWTEIIGSNPSSFKNCEDCPVENVSWNDVQEFIKQLNRKTGKNYRLPTEAEWEYAARGGSSGSPTLYAGSNNIDEVAWYDGNSGSKTHPVGQKKPNELGLYDISGNVWEWCSDWYGSDYYKNSPRNNPQGPASGSYRVLRGGCWGSLARHCRVAFRYFDRPVIRGNGGGFRLVLAP